MAELDATIKASTASDDEENAEEELLSPAEVRKLKGQLTATKKQLKTEKASFADHLVEASKALDGSSARQIVLDAMASDLLAEAQSRITRHRRAVILAFETWWDKYQTPLSTLEAERNTAAKELADLLRGLGYE